MKPAREAVVTGYKFKLVWRREMTSRTDYDGGRDHHVSLVSRLKLGNTRKIRCLTANIRLLQWVPGA
ncbi:hypothetical protein DPMN_067824 [Dreissena polymorpha]|uniref:Uncharacterized protein n=1 Tax=Dreissena polymorpha TaxID=45954 RepID=A0A9D3YVY8_DREPO|nr:hypothetical protein DPMN_067824 [Dreissena polymorpha]